MAASIVPALFKPEDAFKSAYPARIQEFIQAGRQADLAPADTDSEKIALVLVDYQFDFVDPSGSLSVPGAQQDIARFLTWFYTNAQRITSIYASLDTHLPLQIFFDAWWKNPRTGEHPHPFTVITEEDITRENWISVFEEERDWSRQYVHRLKQEGKKDLVIWPYHTMEGTLGHMLVSPISEAIVWHSAARKTQPIFIEKGRTKRTEFYGIFGAEVADQQDPESGLNTTLLDTILSYDRVYMAGEAKSHCVLESAKQLIHYLEQKSHPSSRFSLLKDCTSSVQHPLVDFEALAEAELALLEQQGVQMALSTDLPF